MSSPNVILELCRASQKYVVNCQGLDDNFYQNLEEYLLGYQEDPARWTPGRVAAVTCMYSVLHRLCHSTFRHQWNEMIDFHQEMIVFFTSILTDGTVSPDHMRRANAFGEPTTMDMLVSHYMRRPRELGKILSSLVGASTEVLNGFVHNGTAESRQHIGELMLSHPHDFVLIFHERELRNLVFRPALIGTEKNDLVSLVRNGNDLIVDAIATIMVKARLEIKECVVTLMNLDNTHRAMSLALKTLLTQYSSKHLWDEIRIFLVYYFCHQNPTTRDYIRDLIIEGNEIVLWQLATLASDFEMVETFLLTIPTENTKNLERAKWALNFVSKEDPRTNRKSKCDEISEEVEAYLHGYHSKGSRRGSLGASDLFMSDAKLVQKIRRASYASNDGNLSLVMETPEVRKPIVHLGMERHIARMSRALLEREPEINRNRMLREEEDSNRRSEQRETRRLQEFIRLVKRKEKTKSITKRLKENRRELREKQEALHQQWRVEMEKEEHRAQKAQDAFTQSVLLLGKKRITEKSIRLISPIFKEDDSKLETKTPSFSLTPELQKNSSIRLSTPKKDPVPHPVNLIAIPVLKDLKATNDRLYLKPHQKAQQRLASYEELPYPPWSPPRNLVFLSEDAFSMSSDRLHMSVEEHRQKNAKLQGVLEMHRAASCKQFVKIPKA